MKRALIFVAGVLAFVVLAPVALFAWWFWIGPMFHPPAPPLLQNVTAGGGWFGACPPRNDQEAAHMAMMGEALSPELDPRLAKQFPPGSREEHLVQTLAVQGFRPGPTCQNDPTVHSAIFSGPIRGAIFYIHAVVYWKVENEILVWTKGFVSYDGL